ncbi:MAG TPA: efflux transporter periplasmic adaptor subunit, partial [Porphyromonadaceae bacterium]|nr:efflux transporter periplasmic adaptor subunit [Porphyromonadaceae bacterium]
MTDILLEKKKGLKKKHIPYVIGGALIVACISWLIFGNHASKLNVDAKRLSVQAVTQGEFNDYIRINGQVQPISTIQLSAIEGGMVEAKLVEEGAEVKKGDAIVRLSNPMLSLNILDSEAQLAEKQNFLRNTQVTMEQDKLTLKKEKLQLDLDVTRKQRKYEQYKKLY